MREYSPADYADHAERMQQAVLFRRERHIGVSVVLGFVCDYQRDLRETYWGFFVQLIGYSCVIILPQITQITLRNAAELYYFADKDSL